MQVPVYSRHHWSRKAAIRSGGFRIGLYGCKWSNAVAYHPRVSVYSGQNSRHHIPIDQHSFDNRVVSKLYPTFVKQALSSFSIINRRAYRPTTDKSNLDIIQKNK